MKEANVYESPRKTCRSHSLSNSGGDCGLLPEHLNVLYLVFTYLHLAGNSFMILGLMLDGSSSFQSKEKKTQTPGRSFLDDKMNLELLYTSN